ncbi:MAG: alpha/beta fold hydrolase, partial [Gaiellaceae bacterium]
GPTLAWFKDLAGNLLSGIGVEELEVGWGVRHLHLCRAHARSAYRLHGLTRLPPQAKRAAERFPDAGLHWFEACGHFPHWDVQEEAVRLIRARDGEDARGRLGFLAESLGRRLG